MNIFVRTILSFLLSISFAGFILAQADGIESYEFISPKAGSLFHNPGTDIIIRYGDSIEIKSVNPDLISVYGEKSGEHKGNLVLAVDEKTLTFKPYKPFALKEKVQVVLKKGIKTVNGLVLPEIEFYFEIKNKITENHVDLFGEDTVSQQENINKSTQLNSALFNDSSLFADPLVKIIHSNKPSQGNIFTSLAIYGTNMLYILDNEGNPLYLKIMPKRVINFRPHKNGITSYFDYNKLAYITLDKQMNYLDTYRMSGDYETNMHEFVLLENGHSFLVAFDRISMDLSTVVPGGQPDATVIGAVIQELDENKQVIFEWRTWDHYKITDTYIDLTALSVDYAHVNSIIPDTDSSIIISARHMNEITRINKKNGKMIWRMGGKNNQFQFINENREFAGQHSVCMEANGNLTFYDNGLNLLPQYSRGVEYEVDYQNKKVWLLNEYLHDPLKYGNIMGNLQKLQDGNVLIYWGGMSISENSYFSEYNINKELTLEAEFYNKTLPAYRVYKENREPEIFSLNKDSLLFDSTETGSEKSQFIVLKNISGQMRNITSVHFKSADYYIKEILPFNLLPGEEKSIEIFFAPKIAGNYSSSIVFCSETDSVFISKKLTVNSKSSDLTGIAETGKKLLSAYPNPFLHSFQLSSSDIIEELMISDLNGKIIYKSKVSGRKVLISPDGLEKGIYIISVLFTDKTRLQQRMIKMD